MARSAVGGRTAAVLGAALCLLAPAANAQISPSSNGPIDITADNAGFNNQTCESTWSGAAEALQGDSRLRANVITAVLKKKPPTAGSKPAAAAKPAATGADASLEMQSNCGQTDHIDADGDVFYVTPTQEARSDHAVYSADGNTIVMTGTVVVVQGQNVVRGDRLTINTQTRVAQMYSNAQGRGTPGRVRAVLFPSQSNGQSGNAASGFDLPGLGH